MARRGGPKLTQAEKAYTAIKRAILQGEISEGTFLVESEVMRQYGIGRTPYREACNRLIHEGLLDAVPRRGYMVPEIPFHTVCDTFEVRLILEAAIAELATLRADDCEIEELAKLARQPSPETKSKDDFAELFAANTAFHLRLADMTRNRELVALLKRNLERTERLSYIEWRSSRFHEQELQTQHTRIVDAIRSRNPHAVREALLGDIVEGQRNTMKFGKEVLDLRIGGVSDGATRANEPKAHSVASRRSSVT